MNTKTKDAAPASEAGRKGKAVPAASVAAKPEAKGISKSDLMIYLLTRPEGATVAAMAEATGWMTHSVRGFMAGTLRKRMGKSVTSEKTDTGRIYRIAEEEAA